MAGGHFLSQLHFPSCKNSLLGKPQAHLAGEHFPVAFPECFVPVTGTWCSDVPTAITEERVQGAFLSCSAVG